MAIEADKKRNRDASIIKLYEDGATIREIAKKLGCTPNTVSSVLGGKVQERKEKIEQLKKSVIDDFVKGLTKEQIKEKYHISNTTYVRYTTEEFNKQKEALIQECKRLKASGMLVKEIAKTLGLHRTTVTEYCKK